jgi:hypothetical protein
MIFHMYRVLVGMFYLSLSYDYRGGQSNFECSYPVPSKKQRKDPLLINNVNYLLAHPISQHVY